MEALLRSLDVYRPQKVEKKQSRIETFDNAHKLLERREMIINAFENDVFPLPKATPSFQEGDEDKNKEK